ncbi:MAG: type II secretion system F family protein, partial [Candidatus Thiodiazotropha sp.]|nr:type II secretion system F family protein [Candidatus Thiodiazotropha sp.]
MAIELKKTAPQPSQANKLGDLVTSLKKRKISSKDRRFFTEQLALLLATGTNLHISLQALKKQLDNQTMSLLVEELILDIGEGKQFSYALAKHPDVFSKTYTNL